MLYGFYNYTLHTVAIRNTEPVYTEAVIEMSLIDVFATTAITGFSAGVFPEDNPGGCSCYFKSYSSEKADWSGLDVVELGEASNNSIYVPRCSTLVARLSARQCDAFGQVSVLILSPEHHAFGDSFRKVTALEYHDSKGVLRARQEFSSLGAQSHVDVEQHKKRLSSEIGQKLKVSEVKDYRSNLRLVKP